MQLFDINQGNYFLTRIPICLRLLRLSLRTFSSVFSLPFSVFVFLLACQWNIYERKVRYKFKHVRSNQIFENSQQEHQNLNQNIEDIFTASRALWDYTCLVSMFYLLITDDLYIYQDPIYSFHFVTQTTQKVFPLFQRI